MNKNKKREFTGIHIGTAGDWEGFFIAKAAKEKELGRNLNNDEIHELLSEVSKKENIETLWVEKDLEDVKAILSEHFNTKIVKKKEDI